MKIKNIKFILLLVIALLIQNNFEAQTLKRSGMLGIVMQTLNDSIAKTNGLNINEGVHIITVMPNSTFSSLGIKQGDVLTKLNEKTVNTIQDVLTITRSLSEGDKIEVEYYSNKKKEQRTASLFGKPIETFVNGNVVYDEVVYEGNVLRTILVTPKNKVKAPVVYFLQGYTCGTVETFSDDNPVKKLIRDWVVGGFAVYRIEKPGVGDSQSRKHCTEISFDEELTAFKEGYKDLLQQKAVDTNNIFMFGYSMGGVIAPLLNEMKSPRAIMTYGSIAANWYDYMVDLYTLQPKHFGTSDAQIKEDNKVNLKFNEDFLLNKLSGDEMLKNKSYAEFFNVEDFKRNQYIGRHFKFWQNLADINIPMVWTKVKTNVLAMYGEFDIQAINPKGAKKIAEIVSANGGDGDFVLIKNADHGFVNFNSMQENVETLGNGTYMNHARNNYNTILSKETIKWMKSKLK